MITVHLSSFARTVDELAALQHVLRKLFDLQPKRQETPASALETEFLKRYATISVKDNDSVTQLKTILDADNGEQVRQAFAWTNEIFALFDAKIDGILKLEKALIEKCKNTGLKTNKEKTDALDKAIDFEKQRLRKKVYNSVFDIGVGGLLQMPDIAESTCIDSHTEFKMALTQHTELERQEAANPDKFRFYTTYKLRYLSTLDSLPKGLKSLRKRYKAKAKNFDTPKTVKRTPSHSQPNRPVVVSAVPTPTQKPIKPAEPTVAELTEQITQLDEAVSLNIELLKEAEDESATTYPKLTGRWARLKTAFAAVMPAHAKEIDNFIARQTAEQKNPDKKPFTAKVAKEAFEQVKIDLAARPDDCIALKTAVTELEKLQTRTDAILTEKSEATKFIAKTRHMFVQTRATTRTKTPALVN